MWSELLSKPFGLKVKWLTFFLIIGQPLAYIIINLMVLLGKPQIGNHSLPILVKRSALSGRTD
jgi:hypothetical protein